ncbi:YadA-like family protein [Ralstonia psammae]|nr:YadA-like family protein [Ralstonia sp. LMG 19083]
MSAPSVHAQTANGGLQLCDATTPANSTGYGSNGSGKLSCTSTSASFSLNNYGDTNGLAGFSASTARVTGYRTGLLELKGDAGISLLGAATFNSNASFSGQQIKNLGVGTADTDAVNVSQLKGVFTALGGGAQLNADGTITAPSYALDSNKTTVNTVGAALTNLDTRVTANKTATDANTTHITNLTDGTAGLVQKDASNNLTIGKDIAGTSVSVAGTAGARTLSGVKDGTLSNTSTEAVTGKQLFTTNNRVDQLASGSLGIVQQNASTRTVTIGKDADGADISFANKDGNNRRLVNVANGQQTTDAVNLGQLNTVKQTVVDNAQASADALGGDAAVDATGKLTGPTYTLDNGKTFTSVGTALNNLDARTTTNTTDIAGLKDGTVGPVRQDADTKAISVAGSTGGTSINVAGTDGDRTISGVKAGAADTDAANVGQMNTAVNAVQTNVNNLSTTVSGIDTRVTQNTSDIAQAKTDIGTTNTNVTNLTNTVSSIDTRVTQNTNDISTLSGQINSGSVGLVKQDADTKAISVAGSTGGTSINVAGTDGDRTISGVKAGAADTDAANVGQVKAVQTDVNTLSAIASANATATVNALGGGATVGSDGKITAPTYTLNNGATTVNSVGDALGNLDTRTVANANSISNLTGQMNSGSVGLVQKDAETGDLTIDGDGAGTQISLGGKDASGNAITRKLTNVTAGTADTDAANVGQLKSVDNKVAALQSSAVQYDDASKGTLTLNKGGSATQIKNVADGTDDTDAVNLRQLMKAGMVNPDGTVASVVTYDDASKESATLGGANGTKLTNLTDGSIADGSKDAVTGSQLNASYQRVAGALGGGASLTNGVWTAPSYHFIGGQQYNNVGDALANLDTRVNTLEQGDQSANMLDGNGNDTDTKTEAAATGSNSVASGTNSTAVGANAQANATNSVSLGNNSVADRDNTVSVGSQGSERQITNVMAGVQDTDAVNVKQMNDKVAGVQGQIDTLQSQVNQRFDQMDSRMNRLGAMNAAMSTMVASVAGLQTENRMAIGTGLYRGQTALAIGYQRKIGSRANVTIGGSTAGGTEYNVGVAAGYGW